MSDRKDGLYQEIVYVHGCFDATAEEVQAYIVSYRARGQRIDFNGVGLQEIERRGNTSYWWYAGEKTYGVGEDKPFELKIEIQPSNDPDGKPTEVKITGFSHPHLEIFTIGLVEVLFMQFEVVEDCKLTLPRTGEPEIKSWAEYSVERSVSYQRFLEAFPETDPVPPAQTANEEGEIELQQPEVEGQSSANKNELLADLPDPDKTVSKYGKDREMTKEEVREHIARCISYQEKGYSVNDYYDSLKYPRPFAFETLRTWLKDPKFRTKGS